MGRFGYWAVEARNLLIKKSNIEAGAHQPQRIG